MLSDFILLSSIRQFIKVLIFTNHTPRRTSKVANHTALWTTARLTLSLITERPRIANCTSSRNLIERSTNTNLSYEHCSYCVRLAQVAHIINAGILCANTIMMMSIIYDECCCWMHLSLNNGHVLSSDRPSESMRHA